MGVLNTVRSGLNVLFTPVFYGVVASLALQLTTWEKGDRTQDKLQDQNGLTNKADTFDFIIVGGGTAGSILANRLSEQHSVLLLEAGGEPNPLVYVPGLASHLGNRPEVDWMHRTVAQRKSCLLAKFRRASWSGGKGLGGSGNLDWMIHLRGSPRDFDNWAKLVRDPGWGYKGLLPHFLRHENFVGNTTDGGAHIQGGEMTLQLPSYRPLASEFVWAGKELGYPNLDLNGRFTEGFDEIYYASKRGEKLTTYKTLVEPIKRRDNLTIRRYAIVSKILLRQDDKAVYGVEYERHGERYTVRATKEVIISAGAVGSPKILLHSGIGPRKHLEDVGVTPVIQLPVGRNLQDHLAVHLGPFFIKEPLSFNFDSDVSANAFFEYGTYGTGPLTTAGFQAVGLLSSSFAKLRGEKSWPDLQLLLNGVSVHSNYATDLAHTFGLQEEVLKKYYEHAAGKHSFHIVVTLARPYARGEVRLASRSPSAPLIIDPRYLEDPWNFDMKTLVEGVKMAVELVEGTSKFQSVGGQFTSEVLPGCEKFKFRSDEYFECYVRQFTVSLQNPVGTCTMGPPHSPHAVVDSQLKVIGTKNLRVVDASVMPSVVVGGTQAATMAIAEKGAESILLQWKGKTGKGLQQDQSSSGSGSRPMVVSQLSATPAPTIPAPTTTTKVSLFQGGKFHNFQFDFGANTKTNQNHWQNTLDSIAAFSKTIQETFKVTPVPITTQPTTTTTSTTTTTTTTRPAVRIFPTSLGHPSTFRSPTPHQTRIKFGGTLMPLRTTTFNVPLIPLPTQQVFLRTATPTLSASSSPTPSTTPLPRPTTFRPVGEFGYRTNKTFSLNIPIVTKSPTFGKPHLNSVNIFSAGGRKEPERPTFELQKPVFILPPVTTTTAASNVHQANHQVLQVTTRRPQLFEMIQSEVVPNGYDNFVELPIASVEYRPRPVRPTKVTTTTSTLPSISSSSSRPAAMPPIKIIPAVQISNPLETTTMRLNQEVLPSFHNLIQTQIQTIPQQMFLTGLQPVQLVDMSTVTELPFDVTTPEVTTSMSVHSEKPGQIQSEEAPIFYVVRKKTKQEDSEVLQQREHGHSRPLLHHHHHHHSKKSRRPMQQQRSKLPSFLRKQLRRPPPRPPLAISSQAQSHFPVMALTPAQQQHRVRGSPSRQHFGEIVSAGRDHQAMGSSSLMSAVLPRPVATAEDQMDGIITPAISSPLFQQNVLNQLIPIQK